MNPHAQREQNFLKEIDKGAKNLHAALKEARAIYDDGEFHAWANLKTIDDVEEYLQEHLDKVCPNVTVGEMLAVLAVFPNRSDWGQKSLVDMLEEAKQRSRNANPSPARETRPRATAKELEEAKKDAAFFKQQVKSKDETIAELKETIARQREELAMLRGRIQELERLNKRELQLA